MNENGVKVGESGESAPLLQGWVGGEGVRTRLIQ